MSDRKHGDEGEEADGALKAEEKCVSAGMRTGNSHKAVAAWKSRATRVPVNHAVCSRALSPALPLLSLQVVWEEVIVPQILSLK